MRRALGAIFFVGAFVAAAACRDDRRAPPRPAPATDAATASASGTASAPDTSAATAIAPVPAGDAGACALDVGPLAMDFTGPAAIAATDKGAIAVGNDKGAAHVVTIAGGKGPPPGALRTSSVPCAIARGVAFCPDADGNVRAPDRVIGRARPGTRVAAAELAGHALVAFITERKTSEGMTQTAEVWSDDGATARLSDEGSGATFVELAARDGEVVAITIDAHMGMTPIHARVLGWPGKLALGADAVLMVAGNAEANTAGAIATRKDKGPSFALVPIAKDITAFGVAAVRVEAQPKVDAKVEWSLYDNGLDPAPIAAAHAEKRMLVARVRPAGKQPGAPRVLELGALDDGGRFASFGAVPTHGAPSHVALAADARGAWLAYTDEQGTWVEHRACP